MIWEALGAVIVGFAIALSARRWLPERFPDRVLTLATGPVAALLGALLTRSILGPGHPVQVMVAACAVGAALLSVLVRPPRRRPRRPAAPLKGHHRTAC
ncbi:hypothetical protein ACFU90_12055 [Streptomyces noursei]|uniref:Uncharacterized protein n=1 Tax=Streptomyces noursei TaxID=1971 RepID=A0A059W2R8_STRNR|nr:hypothetical protein [Streptomyces noursei]AKA05885.1 hypothetical protein SAZ_28165 [Streptomyces noursei ZPM]AIA05774.1 hypothetical protein DC74_5312 [Streptomyces noursei]EOT00346.1 hypothetical protein K530_29296 [Streptomyces noursei CCRC 11814]EXU85093.1 hypothetical protein P354_14695 [Streptomyces noursei PD-1]UWS74289.1 hypothetical protein N1H47_25405 [Streptomyces noursei]